MQIKIRKAKKNDIPVIYFLILSATKRGKILKRSKQDISKNLKFFWVAEIENRIVACCAIEIYNRKLAEIRSLVVDHGHEKKGIATSLIEKSIQEVKMKRIYEVLAITDRENIFRRHGFSEQLHGQKALFFRP